MKEDLPAQAPFRVLLGPDGAGKSSVMAELRRRCPQWRFASTDDAFVDEEHRLVRDLRAHVENDVLPALGDTYSTDFLAGLLQTAVLYLRDRIESAPARTPLLVDSYYYKILAKCRIAGLKDNPMYTWWRTFPRPDAVVYLDVSPGTAWRRLRAGAGVNRLESADVDSGWFGFESYQRELRKLMMEEVRQVPVVTVDEQPSVARTADRVLEVLAP
ncbi:hypothetical protein ACIRU3_37060 [Streptomyces sp. NPDC101151]|uniref:hypothetical protein n=1 Tax=Streptomyces sp. NPDC101151 TaxID=3366115 RepID=UPI00380192D8